MEYEIIQGCRPCNAVCDNCERLVRRCMNGQVMYGLKKRGANVIRIDEYQKVLCQDCFQDLPDHFK